MNTTHQEIANELGTALGVISRLMKQLEKKKWIELGRNVIYIRDDFEELISRSLVKNQERNLRLEGHLQGLTFFNELFPDAFVGMTHDQNSPLLLHKIS